MGKLKSMSVMAILVFLILILLAAKAEAQSYKGPSEYTFYMHNTLRNFTNKNFTAIVTAEVADLSPEYNQMGMFITFDDRLTQTSSNGSEQLGTGRGFFLYASQPAHVMFMVFTAVIQNEKYNGTIDIFGQNPTNIAGYRSLSIIGGTGDFLLARGLANLLFIGATRNLEDQQVTWVVQFDLYLY